MFCETILCYEYHICNNINHLHFLFVVNALRDDQLQQKVGWAKDPSHPQHYGRQRCKKYNLQKNKQTHVCQDFQADLRLY